VASAISEPIVEVSGGVKPLRGADLYVGGAMLSPGRLYERRAGAKALGGADLYVGGATLSPGRLYEGWLVLPSSFAARRNAEGPGRGMDDALAGDGESESIMDLDKDGVKASWSYHLGHAQR
jgi:hypothetical protein